MPGVRQGFRPQRSSNYLRETPSASLPVAFSFLGLCVGGWIAFAAGLAVVGYSSPFGYVDDLANRTLSFGTLSVGAWLVAFVPIVLIVPRLPARRALCVVAGCCSFVSTALFLAGCSGELFTSAAAPLLLQLAIFGASGAAAGLGAHFGYRLALSRGSLATPLVLAFAVWFSGPAVAVLCTYASQRLAEHVSPDLAYRVGTQAIRARVLRRVLEEATVGSSATELRDALPAVFKSIADPGMSQVAGSMGDYEYVITISDRRIVEITVKPPTGKLP